MLEENYHDCIDFIDGMFDFEYDNENNEVAMFKIYLNNGETIIVDWSKGEFAESAVNCYFIYKFGSTMFLPFSLISHLEVIYKDETKLIKW